MPAPPLFYTWPWTGEVEIKRPWQFELPTALIATMPQREVVVSLNLPTGVVAVAVSILTWEPSQRGRKRGKVEFPKAIGKIFLPSLPIRVEIEIRVASDEESAKLRLFGPYILRTDGAELVQFVEPLLSQDADGDVDSFGIPAVLARGISIEEAERTWWVTLGEHPPYPTVLRLHIPKISTHTHRLWVPVPRGYLRGPEANVLVSLSPGWLVGSLENVIDGDQFDWVPFAPGGHATALLGGEIGFGVFGTSRFPLRRRVSADVVAWYLGAYLAEGQKTGTGWSFAGVMLPYLRGLLDRVESMGIARSRFVAEVRRTWGMSNEEAARLVSEVLGLPIADRNGAGSGVWPLAVSIYSPDSDGQLSVNLRLRDGLPFRDATMSAVTWFLENFSNVPRSVCLAFALGYFDGDGTVLGVDDDGTNRPILGLSGHEVEVRSVAKVVDRAFGWEGRPWHYTGYALKTQLSIDRVVDLLHHGAFANSMSRARLLDFLRREGGPEAAEFDVESRSVLTALGGDRALSRPGSILPGRKCVAFPTGERVVSADVEGVSFKHWRPLRESHEEVELVNRAFTHYRVAGFPYPESDSTLINYELIQLGKPRVWRMEGTILQSAANGLRVVTSFHPELWSVRCETNLTPMEAWEDDAHLRRALLYCIRMKDGLDRRSVRDAVSTMVARKASVMRPGIAKAIYDTLKPRQVIDPCAGWGSRLFAALAGAIPYVSLDASAEVQDGNSRLLTACREAVPGAVSSAVFHVGLAEETLGTGVLGGGDLVFTSPPYHDKERYSGDIVQSHVRYPSWTLWVAGFLRPLLSGAANEVERGGHVVLSIRVGMEAVVLEAAAAAGLVFKDTWTMLTPRQHFQRDRELASRGDPILIFRKP